MSIDVLPDPVFSGQATQRKASFRNKLEATTTIVAQADTMPRGTARDQVLGAAENKLQNDVMAKSDGSLGGNPSNDWITDPAAQSVVSALVLECTRTLDTMRTPAEPTSPPDLDPIPTTDVEEVTLP